MLDHLSTSAAYNRWANARLYAAVGTLSDAAYRADRGAFFRSIHGTLNHILVADRIWLHRITGEGDAPDRLDTILYDDLNGLERARVAEDGRIVAFVGGLDAADLKRTFTYQNTAGEGFRQELAPMLLHVFNHQTHHRGQVHAMLTGLGEPAPVLDLIFYLREAEAT